MVQWLCPDADPSTMGQQASSLDCATPKKEHHADQVVVIDDDGRTFDDLPESLYGMIFRFLDPVELGLVLRTCHEFHHVLVVDSDAIWWDVINLCFPLFLSCPTKRRGASSKDAFSRAIALYEPTVDPKDLTRQIVLGHVALRAELINIGWREEYFGSACGVDARYERRTGGYRCQSSQFVEVNIVPEAALRPPPASIPCIHPQYMEVRTTSTSA